MKILYFAWLAERIGHPEEEIVLPKEVTTADDVRCYLQARYPELAALLENRDSLRVAVNQSLVDWNQPVTSDDELALFPPMTGG